jgi:hypothetical protein
MENVNYNGHEGILNIHDNSVVFYGICFESILFAIKFIKNINPVYNLYIAWHYIDNDGLKNVKTGQIYIDNRWLPDETFAKNYIDLKIK